VPPDMETALHPAARHREITVESVSGAPGRCARSRAVRPHEGRRRSRAARPGCAACVTGSSIADNDRDLSRPAPRCTRRCVLWLALLRSGGAGRRKVNRGTAAGTLEGVDSAPDRPCRWLARQAHSE
jgi:hypothetical protein